MRKLVLTILLTVLVAPAAYANLTTATDFEDVRTGSFGGFIWESADGFVRDLSWTHQNPFAGDYDEALNQGIIQGVTLSIYADLITENSQDPDQVAISFTDSGRDGSVRLVHDLWTWALPGQDPVGYLKNGWTHYQLDPRWLNGVDVNAAVDYDESYFGDLYDVAYVKYSRLSVTYDLELSLATPPDPIPAPGAILLGGIGIGFVGWLRRRRTI